MKLIIAGGRDFSDFDLLKRHADTFLGRVTEVVSGKARGADTLGENWALINRLKIKRVPAEWKKFGKRAGPIRNKIMGEFADELLAFWDGRSPGTKSMISIMRKLNKPITIIRY